MKSTLILIFLAIFMSISAHATIGAGHVSGKITNITSVSSGVLVRIDANETPQNCTSSQVWMEIKQENTAMISLTITAWTLGRNVTVYTTPRAEGYCQVIQVDPAES